MPWIVSKIQNGECAHPKEKKKPKKERKYRIARTSRDVVCWLECWPSIQEVMGSNPGATTPEESRVFSQIQLIALTYHVCN